MSSTFFATLSRMKYIERWALMRNARPENLSEHCLEVGMIAHALCVIGNVRYGRQLNAEKAALVGIYHDASEIITGDMPTPVKYYNKAIRSAYKDVEAQAEQRLIGELPEDLQGVYRSLFEAGGAPGMSAEQAREEQYMRTLVKAADKICALIKCIEEENAGNREFSTAKETTLKAVEQMAEEMPEVADFMREFLPHYGSTLDELLSDRGRSCVSPR